MSKGHLTVGLLPLISATIQGPRVVANNSLGSPSIAETQEAQEAMDPVEKVILITISTQINLVIKATTTVEMHQTVMAIKTITIISSKEAVPLIDMVASNTTVATIIIGPLVTNTIKTKWMVQIAADLAITIKTIGNAMIAKSAKREAMATHPHKTLIVGTIDKIAIMLGLRATKTVEAPHTMLWIDQEGATQPILRPKAILRNSIVAVREVERMNATHIGTIIGEGHRAACRTITSLIPLITQSGTVV